MIDFLLSNSVKFFLMQVGKAILFLAGPDSSFTTGHLLKIDGGRGCSVFLFRYFGICKNRIIATQVSFTCSSKGCISRMQQFAHGRSAFKKNYSLKKFPQLQRRSHDEHDHDIMRTINHCNYYIIRTHDAVQLTSEIARWAENHREVLPIMQELCQGCDWTQELRLEIKDQTNDL